MVQLGLTIVSFRIGVPCCGNYLREKNIQGRTLYVLIGGLVEETLMYNSQHTANFEFSFPVTVCLPF